MRNKHIKGTTQAEMVWTTAEVGQWLYRIKDVKAGVARQEENYREGS